MRLFPLAAPRVSISKLFPTSFLHSQTCTESSSSHSSSSASTLWFIKVVCTLCINYSRSLTVFNSNFFRQNLNPFVAFGVIFHINTRLNDPKLAFSFFCYSRLNLNLIHSDETFETLLRSLCQSGLHDLARLVYEYMREDGLFPNDYVLDLLVYSLGNAGDYRLVEQFLIAKAEFCDERGERVNSFVYNKFLSLLIGKNRVGEAVAFFKDHVLRLRSFCPDNFSFNIVVGGLCKAGDIDKAFELFDVMMSFHIRPHIVTYNTLINGLCKVGRVDKSLELLRDVQKRREYSPDVKTYTPIISGYCKLGKMEDATMLLDEMVANRIQPNIFTYNTIISGFGKKGELDMALNMYKRMTACGIYPDAAIFTSLIDGHGRHGDVDQCLKLWDEMSSLKVSPNVSTFSALISALCRENRLNEARNFLHQLKRREDIIPPPFVYNPIVDGFCKAGNVDDANVIVAEMEAKGCRHDKMTFTILILGHCMKGRMHEAIGIFEKMLLLGCAPDSITTNSLMACLRKAGMAREAHQIEQRASRTVHGGSSSSKRATGLANTSVRAAL